MSNYVVQVEVATTSNYVFNNTSYSDVVFYPSYESQRLLFGTKSNANAGMTLGSSNISFVVQPMTSNNSIGFFAGNSNSLMTLLGSGNVGVGTTTPAQPLHVVGNVRMDSNLYVSQKMKAGGICVSRSTGSNSSIQTIVSIPGYTFNPANSNVGINNTNPQFPLDVASASGTPMRLATTSSSCYVTMANASYAVNGRFWYYGIDTASNFVVYNNNSNGCYMMYGNSGWSANSDSRLKTNIEPIKDGLNAISQLNPVRFNWKTDEDTKKKTLGLIAQEVRDVLPEVVTSRPSDEYPDGVLGITYTELIPHLIQSIKELNNTIIAMKEEQIASTLQHETEVRDLQEQIDTLFEAAASC